MTEITLDPKYVAIRCTAQTQRLLQNRIEYLDKITGVAVDDLQYFGGRGLPLQPRITLGFAFGKLTLQIGDEPFRIRECAVWCRAHFADLVGTGLRTDHTVIDTGHHRLISG